METIKKTINVTEDDILRGKPGDPVTCPIALASRREFSKCLALSIDICEIRIFVKGGYLVGILPDNASGFIFSFDDGVSCQPFSFDMEFTEESTI